MSARTSATCVHCGRTFSSEQGLGIHFAARRRRLGTCAPLVNATISEVRVLRHVYECAQEWRTAKHDYDHAAEHERDDAASAFCVAERLLKAALETALDQLGGAS